MSKHSVAPAVVIMTALALAALGAPRAMASDESQDTAIEIKAPVDATACTATPAIVTVLGLNIDVTHATFEGGDEGEGGDSATTSHDDDPGDDDGPGTGSCADLTPGASVQLKLASDLLPLEATDVEQDGEEDDASIQAPVQAFDPVAKTITVLGLTIDASQATFEGSDDEDDDNPGVPIDLSQLIVGQIVEVELDSAALPALVATSVDVKNFGNQLEVDIEDENGDSVDDDVADIQVQVSVKGKGHARVNLLRNANGSFVLTGLPTGKAKLRATRTLDGKTAAGKAKARVEPNATRHVKLRLRKAKAN